MAENSAIIDCIFFSIVAIVISILLKKPKVSKC